MNEGFAKTRMFKVEEAKFQIEVSRFYESLHLSEVCNISASLLPLYTSLTKSTKLEKIEAKFYTFQD